MNVDIAFNLYVSLGQSGPAKRQGDCCLKRSDALLFL